MAQELSIESIGAKLLPPPASIVPDREQAIVHDVEDVPATSHKAPESSQASSAAAEPAEATVVIRPRTTKHGLEIGSSRIQSKVSQHHHVI